MSFLRLNPSYVAIKNLISVCLITILLYAAVGGLINVQGVLNQDGGLGVFSLLLCFGTQMSTALIIPQLVVHSIGFKLALVLSEFGFLLYTASNMYPRKFTLLPASAVFGFSLAIQWTIIPIYLQIMSKKYSRLSGKTFFQVQNLFFSIFEASYILNNFFGSILVATILQTGKESQELKLGNMSYVNEINENFDYNKYCGLNNCPDHKLPSETTKTTLLSIYILCGVMIALIIISILITIVFVDNVKMGEDDEDDKQVKIKEHEKKDKNNSVQKIKNEIQNLFKLFTSIDIYLVLPLTTFLAFDLSFKWTEFNRAFIACLTSVNYIGWMSMLMGVSGAIFSIACGYITRYITQSPIIILALSVSISISIFLLSWTPNPNAIYVLYLVCFAFSFSQAVLPSQTRGLYGTQFVSNVESAFSANCLFMNFGFFAGYLVSAYTCTIQKLFIYFILACLSLAGYLAILIKNGYRTNNNQTVVTQIEANGKETILDNEEKVTFLVNYEKQ